MITLHTENHGDIQVNRPQCLFCLSRWQFDGCYDRCKFVSEIRTVASIAKEDVTMPDGKEYRVQYDCGDD